MRTSIADESVRRTRLAFAGSIIEGRRQEFLRGAPGAATAAYLRLAGNEKRAGSSAGRTAGVGCGVGKGDTKHPPETLISDATLQLTVSFI